MRLVVAFLLTVLLLAGCGSASGPDNTKCVIKGNVNDKGERIYHMPNQQFYGATKPERWFCTEEEAKKAGFRKSKR